MDLVSESCYKSYMRSIEQTFEAAVPPVAPVTVRQLERAPNDRERGTTMAIAATFPSAHPLSSPGSVHYAARTRSRLSHKGHSSSRTTLALRLTRRGRMVLGVLLSVPFAAVVMVVGSLSADADTTSPSGQAATGVVVVQPGESLWQIARQVAPHADPRATLTVIRDLNGLGGDTVVPGQALVVPNPA